MEDEYDKIGRVKCINNTRKIMHTHTCLLASSRAVTPRSWKQSAATAVDARNRSMMFTARQQHSKDRRKYLCTGMSQLTSLQRASGVTCMDTVNDTVQLISRLHGIFWF